MTHTSQSISNKAALQPYKLAISRYFRSLLTLKAVTYPQLAERLSDRGIVLTPENLRNKVARGLIPADLLIVLLDALGEGHSSIEPISTLAKAIANERAAKS